MHTADAIRKLGFKRWYEKALIRSHAHLVTCFLGMTLAIAGVEMVGQHGGFGHTLWGTAAGMAGIALTFFGWHHYHRILRLAEHLGAGATCKSCGTYAAFTLLAASADTPELTDSTPEADTVWLKVKCRHCGNEWTI
jgi:hypothetical protein